MKQILIHVSDLPKQLATKNKIEPLGSQKLGFESEQLKVIGLGYLIMPFGTKNL